MRRGAQEPRVSNFPAYTETAGPEAADLIASAGQPCDRWQCIVLDRGLAERDDGRWACREIGVFVPRQNGKGVIIEAVVLHGLFIMGYRRIVWTAHEYKTAAEGYDRIKSLINASPELLSRVKIFRDSNGKEGIELHDADAWCANAGPDVRCDCETGTKLRFIARSKGSGRGFSGDLIILDEAQFLTLLEMKALFSTMSARPNAQIWYFGTPPEAADAWIYSVKADGERGKPRLCWLDWGQDPEALGYDPKTGLYDLALCADRDRWFESNPSLNEERSDGSGITEEFCEDEYDRLGQGFAAERLGAWLPRAMGSSEIPAELWRDRIAETVERPKKVVYAAVVDHSRKYSVIAACGPREDGRLQVSLVDVRPGTRWVVPRMTKLRDYEPLAFTAQDKGPTGSLMSAMEAAGFTPPEDRDEPERGDLIVPWSDDVAAAYGLFMDALRDDTLVHLDEGPLNLAAHTAETRPLGSGTAWAYKGEHAAVLIAVSQAHWCYVTYAPVISVEYDPLQNFW